MNSSVALFFGINVLAAAIIGGKFLNRKNPVFKYFGIGLLLDALAFAFWTIGYVNSNSLLVCVTLGAVTLLISLVFFLYASLQNHSATNRVLGTMLGVIAVIVIYVIGRNSPNVAYISPEGLLFFNLTPLVQMLYVFALAFTFLPLTDLVASKFSSPYSGLVRYGFIAQFVGGIMLITNTDVQVLYITGWMIGIVYIVLCVLFFNNKVWHNTN
jgi:heme/copper-type cytochrome/quinol oxidase subunit 4